MNEELSRKRQELARQLVAREVYYCVSSLMYGIAQIMWDCRNFKDAFGNYPDDLLALYQQDDWETPGRYFIEEDADLSQLEEIADKYGYWSDVLEESNVPIVEEFERNEDTLYVVAGKLETEYDDEDDARDAAIDSVLPVIREKVAALVDTEANGWQEVCNEYGLDPETHEVYEHWLVSSWLARKLAAEGEVVGEFAGLTIWGRCATGQAIYMDGVIETITAELYPEEWNGSSNPV